MSPTEKRRVKTGCLTCRQRRVKCDETRPVCKRCEAANVECNGYQSPRKVVPRQRSEDQSNTNSIEEEPRSQPTLPVLISKVESPLFGCDPEASQRPHQRAREMLGYQQYSSRTVKLLFREDHLWFWRDYILTTAWDVEYVFDAVIALGIMHRAVLMLSDPSDKRQGLDNKVVAFQVYANALKKLSEKCGEANGQPSDKLVAVLLLLTYFECFVGNYISAFQHLRAAQSYLDETSSSLPPNSEPLVACVSELGLMVQIIIPLPLVNFPFVGVPRPTNTPYISESPRGSSQDLQELLNLICSHRMINVAIWLCVCTTEDRLSHKALTDFQSRLLLWKAQSASTFQNYEDNPSLLEPAESLATLPIPPKPLAFLTVDAALAASTFHAYMGRILCMISLVTGGDENLEKTASLHIYHTLRIVQGIEQERKEREFHERQYFPCNAVKIGFIPVLFLSSQVCYNSVWVQFIIDKLLSIGQEGLYNGESFANSLQSLGLFQAVHAQKLRASRSVTGEIDRISSLRFNVASMLIPGPCLKTAVAYYVQPLETNRERKTIRDRRELVQIVGMARWGKSDENTSTSVSMEFFGPNHPINQGLTERCLYVQIASNESIVQAWETLLGTEALGPHGYFVHLATLGNSIMEGMNSGLETITGMDNS